MFRKSTLYWISQFGGWLVYILILAVFNKLSGNDLSAELLYSLLSIYLIGILLSHTYRTIMVRLNWMQFNILKLIPRIIVGSVVFGVVVYFVQSLVLDIVIAKANYVFDLADAFQKVINWTLLWLMWSLLYFLFHFITNYKKEEIKNLKWQATKNEVELNRLKSQLNPHFVFNSMNSIRALISDDPVLAKDAITQLSNVLRSSLLMGKKKVIPFREEMKLVNDYLGLEKTRFEERLIIVRDIEKDVENFLIPPLMLQTLVENGIKHGTSTLPKGGTLKISAQQDDENLKITIENSGIYDDQKPTDTGFGILNTKQRLQLLYGKNEGLFRIENSNAKVKTTLVIPQITIL